MGQPSDQPPSYPQQPQGQQPYGQHQYGQQPYPSAPPPGYGYPQPAKQGNGLAIASLVCGIIGLLIFGVVLGPLAVIFGAIGLSRANRGASGKGMAIAGIVLGAIATIVAIILIAIITSHGFVY
jgi:Domain of unknown function (DUF4190)